MGSSVKLVLRLFSYTILGVLSLFIPRFLGLPRFYRESVDYSSKDSLLEIFLILVVIFIVSLFALKIKKASISILFWYFFILMNIFWWPFAVYGIWYSTSQESFGNMATFPIAVILAFVNVFVLKLFYIGVGNQIKKRKSWHALIKIPIIFIIIVIILGGAIIGYRQLDKKEKPWKYPTEELIIP